MSLSKEQRRERRRNARKVNQQRKQAATRAKYGPSMKPNPVTIKKADGTVEVRRGGFKSRKYSPKLDQLAVNAGYDSYAVYLVSPYWKEIRREVLKRAGWRCEICRKKKKQLQVHHDRYEHIGNEKLKFLKAMCNRCHKRIHT